MFAILILFVIVLIIAFALKDVFTREMDDLYKILWTIVILAFPILGVCAYYFSKSLGVHKDPRTAYRERYYQKAHGDEQDEEDKPTEKKSGISNVNLFLIIFLIFGVIAFLFYGYFTLDIPSPSVVETITYSSQE